MKNCIPYMTDIMGQYWKQPNDIIHSVMDDKHVILSMDQITELRTYQRRSVPSGVYPGKCWKYSNHNGWVLCWFGEVNSNNQCKINSREILHIG